MIEDEDADLAGADIILHVSDPEINGLTDDDSDESDDKTQGNINYFRKGMLNTLCNVVPHYREETPEDDEAQPSTSGLPSSALKKKRTKSKTTEGVLWHKEIPVFDINHSQPTTKTIDDEVLTIATELDLLKMLFIDDFMEEVVNQTNLKAKQKSLTLNVTRNELLVFYRAFLLSSYAKHLKKRFIGYEKMTIPQFYLMLYDAKGLNR